MGQGSVSHSLAVHLWLNTTAKVSAGAAISSEGLTEGENAPKLTHIRIRSLPKPCLSPSCWQNASLGSVAFTSNSRSGVHDIVPGFLQSNSQWEKAPRWKRKSLYNLISEELCVLSRVLPSPKGITESIPWAAQLHQQTLVIPQWVWMGGFI